MIDSFETKRSSRCTSNLSFPYWVKLFRSIGVSERRIPWNSSRQSRDRVKSSIADRIGNENVRMRKKKDMNQPKQWYWASMYFPVPGQGSSSKMSLRTSTEQELRWLHLQSSRVRKRHPAERFYSDFRIPRGITWAENQTSTTSNHEPVPRIRFEQNDWK